MDNLGKKFEVKFKQDFLKSVPNSLCIRLADQVSGYKFTSSNICDFICYSKPNIFLCECKTHKGASIPFDNISQYDKLVDKVGIDGVRAGVILWLYEKDKLLYVPISTITKMKSDGKKSVGIKSIEEGYNVKEIPGTKKRTFIEGDYSMFLELLEGE